MDNVEVNVPATVDGPQPVNPAVGAVAAAPANPRTLPRGPLTNDLFILALRESGGAILGFRAFSATDAATYFSQLKDALHTALGIDISEHIGLRTAVGPEFKEYASVSFGLTTPKALRSGANRGTFIA